MTLAGPAEPPERVRKGKVLEGARQGQAVAHTDWLGGGCHVFPKEALSSWVYGPPSHPDDPPLYMSCPYCPQCLRSILEVNTSPLDLHFVQLLAHQTLVFPEHLPRPFKLRSPELDTVSLFSYLNAIFF